MQMHDIRGYEVVTRLANAPEFQRETPSINSRVKRYPKTPEQTQVANE
jgi:hypothetical protein